MELFLPSFFVLILSGVLVFFIIPRFSPFIIFILCIIFLLISVRTHWMMFSTEYNAMLTSSLVKNAGPGILIAVITIGMIIGFLNLFAGFKINVVPSFPSSNLKVITNKKNYASIPIEKLMEAEKQL